MPHWFVRLETSARRVRGVYPPWQSMAATQRDGGWLHRSPTSRATHRGRWSAMRGSRHGASAAFERLARSIHRRLLRATLRNICVIGDSQAARSSLCPAWACQALASCGIAAGSGITQAVIYHRITTPRNDHSFMPRTIVPLYVVFRKASYIVRKLQSVEGIVGRMRREFGDPRNRAPSIAHLPLLA